MIQEMIEKLVEEAQKRSSEAGEFLFQLTYAQLRAQFRMALRFVGLAGGRVGFHSIRHGGATTLYLKGHTLDAIAHAGRWRSLTTARRYVQQGAALLSELRLSTERRVLGESLLKRWPFRIG